MTWIVRTVKTRLVIRGTPRQVRAFAEWQARQADPLARDWDAVRNSVWDAVSSNVRDQVRPPGDTP